MKGTSGSTLGQGGQAWRWLLPQVTITLLIGSLSLWTYRIFSAEIQVETARSLAAIAEEKRAVIERWLANTESDARIFFTGTSCSLLLLEEWIAGGRQDEALLSRLRVRLEEVAQEHGWGGLTLYDVRAEPLVVIGDAGVPLAAERVQDILTQPRLERLDAQADADGVWRYRVLAPVGATDRPPVVVAVLSWSLEQALLPLLNTWLLPSPGTGSALIRREDESVRFLMTMDRDRAGTQLPFPEGPRRLSVLAAQGQRGVIEGVVDHRGVSVLGHATDIAGTSWILLTRIDRTTAESERRELALALTLATLLVLILLYTIGFGLWRWDRQRRAAIAREREEGLRRQEQQTRQLLDAILASSTDAIFAKDLQGRYLLAN